MADAPMTPPFRRRGAWWLAVMALWLAAAPVKAQTQAEHAAWVSVGFAVGSLLVAANGYGLMIEGVCVESDADGCAAVVDQQDWLLGLDVIGLVLGAVVLGATTYVAMEPSTYGWRARAEDVPDAARAPPPVRVAPVVRAGPRGGLAGLEVRF